MPYEASLSLFAGCNQSLTRDLWTGLARHCDVSLVTDHRHIRPALSPVFSSQHRVPASSAASPVLSGGFTELQFTTTEAGELVTGGREDRSSKNVGNRPRCRSVLRVMFSQMLTLLPRTKAPERAIVTAGVSKIWVQTPIENNFSEQKLQPNNMLRNTKLCLSFCCIPFFDE